MPMVEESPSDGKVLGLFRNPFRNAGNAHVATSSSSSSHVAHNHGQQGRSQIDGTNSHGSSSSSVASVARSLLPKRRRLRLDPATKLYLPYEPGKQVRSAISIKNTSKSHVAFKFQTTEPKSCFMRPPGAILAPGESLIATVFKFVEQPENNEKPVDQKCKVKFKIMSLKVEGAADYAPELFDELKDQVAIEQILRVVFLDPERPSRALEKLKQQLAEAEAELEARKKPAEDNGSKIIGEGLVIDEWVSFIVSSIFVILLSVFRTTCFPYLERTKGKIFGKATGGRLRVKGGKSSRSFLFFHDNRRMFPFSSKTFHVEKQMETVKE